MRRLHMIDEPEYAGIFYRHHNPEVREAYECGKKDGWREAMLEAEYSGFGQRGGRNGYSNRGGMGYRDEDDYEPEYDERRRRSSRTGRYI